METSSSPLKPADDNTSPRVAPVIKPASVVVHAAGFAHKEIVVTAPEDLAAQDLNDHPEIWKLVQSDRNGKALSEFDKIEIRAREWIVTARVNHASADRVTLFDIRRVSKPQREVALYADDTYEVIWAPEGGYTYRRIKDKVRMASVNWPTPESAKHELLRREYPATQSGVVFT